jgi:hypothetical protein
MLKIDAPIALMVVSLALPAVALAGSQPTFPQASNIGLRPRLSWPPRGRH